MIMLVPGKMLIVYTAVAFFEYVIIFPVFVGVGGEHESSKAEPVYI